VTYPTIMSAATKPQPVSVDDYLAGEVTSRVKHEYLGGYVYAMAGGTNAHNRIASNILGALHGSLKGKPCEPYNSDTKIRVKLPTHVGFYYPDVSVVCESNPAMESFQDLPAVVVEVLSRQTRRADQGEKKDAYLSIPSLSVYLLVEQETAAITVYRRTEQGFVEESYTTADETIPLTEIGVELAFADVYERVEFVPEPDDEEKV
jgi:Uma2 family endonuclease